MLNEPKQADPRPAPQAEKALRRPVPWRAFGEHALQLAVAAAGGGLFSVLGVPAAWLSGSMLGVMLLVVLKRARGLPDRAVDGVMLLGGASMGAGASPEALAAIARYPVSLAILLLAVLVSTAASVAVLKRRPGWTADEAILACIPGALSTVLAIAADRRVRLGPIAIVQMVRLMAVVLLMPSIVTAIGGGAGNGMTAAPQVMDWHAFAAILSIGAVLGLLFKRAGLSGPMLLGAMTVSIASHASGLVNGGLHPLLAIATLVLLGVMIATRIRTLNRQQIRAVLPDAAIAFGVGLSVAAAFAALVSLTLAVHYDVALVAFAPGGFEAMTILALVLGLDPLYVGTHHITRFLAIGFALPLFMARRHDKPDAPEDDA